MAAPNLLNPTTINGKQSNVDLSSTSATSILSNASSSGKCLIVTGLTIANDDSSNSVDVTINLYPAAALSGTPVQLGNLITVAPKQSVVIVDANNKLYMEENTSIGATASNANRANVIASYLDVS